MISESGEEMKITKMTLAVAKDSGWYEVDLTKGENYFWGKDQGCDIFKTTCSNTTVDQFCSVKNEMGCTDNHVERTICWSNLYNENCPINIFSENCKVYRDYPNEEFTYGKDSVCLKRDVIYIYIYFLMIRI